MTEEREWLIQEANGPIGEPNFIRRWASHMYSGIGTGFVHYNPESVDWGVPSMPTTIEDCLEVIGKWSKPKNLAYGVVNQWQHHFQKTQWRLELVSVKTGDRIPVELFGID